MDPAGIDGHRSDREQMRVLEVKDAQYLKSVEGKAAQADLWKELGAPSPA